MNKTCTKCRQVKPLEDFVKASRNPDGHSCHCKACHNALYYQKRPVAQPLHPGDTKQCTKCGKVKPVDEFDKSDRYRTGYTSNCKTCQRAMSYRWKRNHQQEVREYQRQWSADHPRDDQEYQRQYRIAHIERRRMHNRAWYMANREQVLAYRRRYYTRNKARIIRQSLEYYHTPHGKAVVVNARHKRRAAKQQHSDITADWLEQLYNIQSCCAYCGREFGDELPPTLDHFIPLSKGGTHTKNNVLLACLSCNASKSDNIIDISCIAPECVSQLREFLAELPGHPIRGLL